MSKILKEHIKKLNKQNGASANKDTCNTVSGNLNDDGNADVAAQGALLESAGGNLGTAITNSDNLHNEAEAATGVMKTKHSTAAEVYNAAAVVVEQKYPNNPDKWKELGFEVTVEHVSDGTVPEKVVHGSMTQGDELKTCDIHFDATPGAENYTLRMTKGNPADDSSYIQVTSPRVSYTKSSITINIPDDYLNFTLWFKATANNATGKGPESDPFGGRKIQ